MRIKRISPLSLAKFQSIMFIFIGLFFGIIFAATGGTILNMFTTDFSGLSSLSIFIWIAGIILFPISFAISGFILGLIEGFVYNLTANISKGLEIELEEESNQGYNNLY